MPKQNLGKSTSTARMSTGGRPPKKPSAQATRLPSPGSDDYDELPPVNIAFQRAARSSTELKFGSTDITPSQHLEEPAVIKRTRKLSRKLRESMDLQDLSPKPTVKKPLFDQYSALPSLRETDPFPPLPKRKRETVDHDDNVHPYSLKSPSRAGASPASPRRLPRSNRAPLEVIEITSSSNGSPDEAKLSPSQSEESFLDDRSLGEITIDDSPLLKREPSVEWTNLDDVFYTPSKRRRIDTKYVTQSSQEADDDSPPRKRRIAGDHTESPSVQRNMNLPSPDGAEISDLQTPPPKGRESQISASLNIVASSSREMLDKGKRRQIDTPEPNDQTVGDMLLPSTPWSIEVTPFPSNQPVDQSQESNTMLDLKAMKYDLDRQPTLSRRVVLGITFSHSQNFVNPARAPTSYLSKSSDRIVIANSGGYPSNALLLMTGAVSESNLYEPHDNVRGFKMSRSRRIGIFPFLKEYERAMSCIGFTLKLRQVMANIISGAVFFSTRNEVPDAPGKSSHGSTPKKTNWFAKDAPSNITPVKKGIFPSSLGFDADVPIYDVRGQGLFDFLPSDFSRLTTLPRWEGATSRDLPPWSMVTVGYTANSYKYSVGGKVTDQNSLSLNVMFVLLHGLME